MKLFHYLLLPVVALSMLATSCSDNDHFVVSGTINSAESGTVYLVREGIDSVVVCDSAVFSSSGSFKLKGRRRSAPEFYSLRVDSSSLWLAVDSTEHIEVTANRNLTDCRVKGSVESEQLLLWQKYIRTIDDSLTRVITSPAGADRKQVDLALYGLVKAYKDTVNSFVQKNPASPVSYYLLFKKVTMGLQPFEPLEREDFHSFAVLANAWNKRYPDDLRSAYLKDLVKGIQQLKQAEQFQQLTANTPKTGFLDLEYPNAAGQQVKLSSLKGKNVLVEFCFLAQLAGEVNEQLAQIREKYRKNGFEIYMVTFDKNPEVWKQKASALPWIVVLDAEQTSALTYNFKNVPTNYFIDKNGNIVGRDVSLAEIDEYLKCH